MFIKGILKKFENIVRFLFGKLRKMILISETFPNVIFIINSLRHKELVS